jgi:hypothetical protein
MAAKFDSAPSMSYYAPQGPVGQGNWQGQSMGATIPATYDPNAPPQSYRFNGYGQDMGGPVSFLEMNYVGCGVLGLGFLTHSNFDR